MLLGLGGALAAALLYGAGTVLQARGVTGRPIVYAAGLTGDLLGFLASLLAVRHLPLVVVQSAVASSVAVTALLAVWWLGARLGRREVAGIAAVAVGLVALAAAAREGAARPIGHRGELWLCACVAPILVAGAAAYLSRRSWSGPVLAAVAGLGFSGTAIAARVLPLRTPWWRTATEPALWALAAYGLIALVAFGYALTRAKVTAVAALTFVVETVVPAGVGAVWLHDRLRPGTTPLAVVGLVLTLAGCWVLARFAAPEIPGGPETPD
ncbi:hypothetical protein GCM10028801_43770 [Nocardioides maradonensis]